MSEWTPASEHGWSSLLGSVEQMVGYNKYTTVADTAAAVLYGGSTTQYLIEGNKRLALAATVAQLLWNGYLLDVDDDTMYVIAMLVAQTGNGMMDEVIGVVSGYVHKKIIPAQ